MSGSRLSIEEVRELLGPEDAQLTDEQVVQLRETGYAIARGFVELYRTQRRREREALEAVKS